MAEAPEQRFPSACAMRAALLSGAATIPSLLPSALEALSIEARAAAPAPWITIEVQPVADAPSAVRHLTSALVEEMSLLLGRIPHVRLAVGEPGEGDLVVACTAAAEGPRVGCTARWKVSGETVWSGRAPLLAGRIVAAAETFARSIALAVNVPDPHPAAVSWPAAEVLDTALRARFRYSSTAVRDLPALRPQRDRR